MGGIGFFTGTLVAALARVLALDPVLVRVEAFDLARILVGSGATIAEAGLFVCSEICVF